ncbi:MAG: phytanoyl-CoA dioxygenase family protein [Gammaproteobacteria bacterium]|nr:phytanoyl-CoA dioxygenase family protein [Gammaproteobacteria bacterium]
MGLFNKRSAKRYLDPCHHRDSPADELITSPEIHLRGWFAVDPALVCERIDLKNGDGWSLRLAVEQRPDVERVYPNRTVVGFDTLVSSETIREQGGSAWELVLKCDAATYSHPLILNVSEKLPEDGYYRSRDPLDGPYGDVLSPEQKASWRDDGFLLLPKFFDATRLDAINTLVDELWRTRAALTEPVTLDAYIGAETVRTLGRRYLMKEVPESARQSSYKINDLFLSYPAIRDLVLDETLSGYLRALLDGDPVTCNSLYFEYGSEQPDHFDTFFMPPRVRNRMAASWIALDDVTPENGPLQYYPGSHLIDPYLFADGRYNRAPEERKDCERYIAGELKRRQIEPTTLLASKGDVFIWHAHLLHGGAPIRKPGHKRRSLVTHYYRTAEFSDDQILRHAPGRYYQNRPHPAPQTP